MTNEERDKTIEQIERIQKNLGSIGETVDYLDFAIEALEQQPSEKCVSRDDVDAYIAKLMSGYLYDEERTRLEEFSAYLWELPPVTPQSPKGNWIYKMQAMNNPYTYKCSVCKGWEKDKTKYCPNCGAEMSEVAQNENDS